MINPEFIKMIEHFHKPAQNVRVKTTHILVVAALATVAIIAIKATIEKSKEIQKLNADSSRKNETTNGLTSKINMLEYDQSLHLSSIETLTAENKALNDQLIANSNVEKS